jgi:2-keto-4-pentenoate hydratase/2-oxohepta-3-ene-1,7-dioic acid hydratase in catechol pathway
MDYHLLTYSTTDDAAPRAGILVGERVIPVAPVLEEQGESVADASAFGLLQEWANVKPVLEKTAANGAGERHALHLDDVTLHAPLLYPGAIFCTAGNYSDHVKEMAHGYEVEKDKFNPYFFLKAPPNRAIIGPNAPIRIPGHSKKLDWEAELAFVIGKRATNVSAADAMEHVAGYVIINDLSARDHLFREDWKQFKTDWFGQKCFDGSVPMGPWITPVAQMQDTSDVSIQLWLNGELRQNTSTRYMIFNVAEQIEALSRQITLEPGDLVCTGTGAGVGGKLSNGEQLFLQEGDRLKITIEHIGSMENTVV